jgi:hypothetical protein
MLSSRDAKKSRGRVLWCGRQPIACEVHHELVFARAREAEVGVLPEMDGVTAERYSSNPLFGTPQGRNGWQRFDSLDGQKRLDWAQTCCHQLPLFAK